MDKVVVACSKVLSPAFALNEQRNIYQPLRVLPQSVSEALPFCRLA